MHSVKSYGYKKNKFGQVRENHLQAHASHLLAVDSPEAADYDIVYVHTQLLDDYFLRTLRMMQI